MSVKRTAALCCLGLLGVSGCGRQQSSTKKLAFITNNAADFWTIARKGTEKADAGLPDVEVEFRLGDGTAAAQKRILDDLLAKGVDGIAISPVDPANQTAMLNDAAKQARTRRISRTIQAADQERANHEPGIRGKRVKKKPRCRRDQHQLTRTHRAELAHDECAQGSCYRRAQHDYGAVVPD